MNKTQLLTVQPAAEFDVHSGQFLVTYLFAVCYAT